jgi:hypothetical protein
MGSCGCRTWPAGEFWRASATPGTRDDVLPGDRAWVLLPSSCWRPRFGRSRRGRTGLHNFVVHRLNVSVTGMERASGVSYFPSWMEIAVSLGLVAAGFALFGLAVRYLPIFEEAGHPAREVEAPSWLVARLPNRARAQGRRALQPLGQPLEGPGTTDTPGNATCIPSLTLHPAAFPARESAGQGRPNSPPSSRLIRINSNHSRASYPGS